MLCTGVGAGVYPPICLSYHLPRYKQSNKENLCKTKMPQTALSLNVYKVSCPDAFTLIGKIKQEIPADTNIDSNVQ